MRPSYFDPAPAPDTETQYRRGGKVKTMTTKKPAKKMPRKFAEGGVTEDRNKNIDDDTRSRALAMINMRSEAGESRAPSAKISKAAPRKVLDTGDETKRLVGRGKSASRGLTHADDPSIPDYDGAPKPDKSVPSAKSDYEPYKPSVGERIKKFASDAGSEVMRNASALGPMAVGAAAGAAGTAGIRALRAAKAAKSAQAIKQAEETMASGASRAKGIRNVAKEEVRMARRTPKDLDEASFADEGNPNFKKGGKVKKYVKGGSVKGWGMARGSRKAKVC